jgi:hypothetical protein
MKVNDIFKIMLLVTTVGFVSCKKDKDVPAACEFTQNSLAGTYQLTALKYRSSPSAAEVDYLTFMEVCERDDRIRLNNNGTYNYTDEGFVCSPTRSEDGTWSVTGNQLESDGLLTGTIISYDCKVLTYCVEGVYTDGDRLTFTMTKQ